MGIIKRLGLNFTWLKKLFKKKLFKIAPIHHHFEQLGWPESKVIARFWIIGIILALVSLSSLKLR